MNVRRIDLSTYPRRSHFEHFLTMANPFTGVTVNVDITDWLRWQQSSGYPFFLCFQYAAVHAANRVPQLRQRIVDGGICEYDFCDPSYIVSLPDGTYRYCLAHARQPLAPYIEQARRSQARAMAAEGLEEEGDPLGQLFITCLPWLTFTSLQIPWSDAAFSNPGISWGRFERHSRLVLRDGEIVESPSFTLPVNITVNHALVDGIHIARFFACLDEELVKMRKSGPDGG